MRGAPDPADDLKVRILDVVLSLLFGPELILQVLELAVGLPDDAVFLPEEVRTRDPSRITDNVPLQLWSGQSQRDEAAAGERLERRFAPRISVTHDEHGMSHSRPGPLVPENLLHLRTPNTCSQGGICRHKRLPERQASTEVDDGARDRGHRDAAGNRAVPRSEGRSMDVEVARPNAVADETGHAHGRRDVVGRQPEQDGSGLMTDHGVRRQLPAERLRALEVLPPSGVVIQHLGRLRRKDAAQVFVGACWGRSFASVDTGNPSERDQLRARTRASRLTRHEVDHVRSKVTPVVWPTVPDVERTLVLVKPDAVARGLTGEIIGRLERKGLKILALEQRTLDRAVAEEHYGEHSSKPFFGELVDFITGGPLVALVAEGHRAVEAVRTLMGVTDPVKSAPGSIRGDLALVMTENLVHGSDSPESAAREVKLFFPDLS